MEAIKLEGVSKSYKGKTVLKDVSISVKRGENLSLIGASGSGKTTLIRTINGFVIPDSGQVFVEGNLLNYKNKRQIREVRKRVGMVYQLFNLVDRLTVLENVLTGALGKYDTILGVFLSTLGVFRKEDVEKAKELIAYVGLEDKIYERVDRLSGGQKQRVAIARALMQDPQILLADEPIASLDPKTSRRILDLLTKINIEKGITIVCVLHHIDTVKEFFNRVVALKEGSICFDSSTSDLNEELLDYIYEFDEEYQEERAWKVV